MTRHRAFVIVAVILLALSGCGGGDSSTSGTSAGAAAASVPTMTAPGGSTEVVTDVQARSVPEDQVDQILANCAQSAGVPGTSDRCEGIIAQLRPCQVHDLCVLLGRLADHDVGVIQMREERPGRAACTGDGARLCAGVTIPASVVDRLSTAPTPGATDDVTPSPTPSLSSTSSPSPGVTSDGTSDGTSDAQPSTSAEAPTPDGGTTTATGDASSPT